MRTRARVRPIGDGGSGVSRSYARCGGPGDGGKDGPDGVGFALGSRLRGGEREDLPDSVGVAGTEGPVGDEGERAEVLEGAVELRAIEAEEIGHPPSAEERRALPVAGEGKKQEDGGGFGAEFCEPAVVEEPRLEPAEGLPRPAVELRPGRFGAGTQGAHVPLPFARGGRRGAARRLARCASRSFASFRR